LIKRFAFLSGQGPNPLDKIKGPTAEEELAEEIRKRQVGGQVVSFVHAADDMVNNREGGRP
jgi:hypothetical protein